MAITSLAQRNATLPDELKALPNWTCVCRVDGKKQPAYKNGKPMKWGTSANWYAFAEVEQQADLEFILSPESGLIGFDFDGCVHDGVIFPLVHDWCVRSGSYAEISESGRGVKLFLRGVLPPGFKKFRNVNVPWKVPGDDHAGIEVHNWQPFAVTGKLVENCLSAVGAATEVLNEILVRFAPAPKIAREAATADEERTARSFDFDAWVHAHLEIVERLDDGYSIRCPWSHEHTTAGDTARIWRGDASHPHTFHCFHSHCAGRVWRDVRLCYEPAAYLTLYHPASAGHTNGNGNGAAAAAPPDGGRFNRTDLGNAERFASLYRDRVRWCHEWNCWLVYNGRAWEKDMLGLVDQYAKKVVRSIYREAAAEEDDAERRAIAKHAFASESSRAVRALLDRVKSELPTRTAEFNRTLHLMNFWNGTLDLRTGELRPHDPRDMMTRCLNTAYRPTATCPLWDATLLTLFAGDTDMIAFLHQALGMSLSGDTREQCWFLNYGGGNNGKSTILETVRDLLGEYALSANIETFQVRKNEQIGNDVAEFYGARFITAGENKRGSRLNEAFLKKITGGEPLRARRLHENEFQFMPECSIWLSVNHKPVVQDTSKGMWRRVRFIPWTVTLLDSQIDTDLPRKLKGEAEGILARLVAGCVAWYRQGRLSIPPDVKKATQAYQDEMDIVGTFIDEHCERVASAEIGATELYKRYRASCEENGERYETQNGFGARLTELGLHRVKTRSGVVYRGLRFRPTDGGGDGASVEGNDEETDVRVMCEPCEPCEPISKVSYIRENTSKITSKIGSQGSQGSHTAENSPAQQPDELAATGPASPSAHWPDQATASPGLGLCSHCKFNQATSIWLGSLPWCPNCKQEEMAKWRSE